LFPFLQESEVEEQVNQYHSTNHAYRNPSKRRGRKEGGHDIFVIRGPEGHLQQQAGSSDFPTVPTFHNGDQHDQCSPITFQQAAFDFVCTFSRIK
jgi:hypothetical protein